MRMLSEREAVVAACQALVREGLVVGTAGNVSVRVGEVVAISPSGVDYLSLEAADIPLVDLAGNQLEGELKPSSELPLHLRIYAESDSTAVVHTHAVSSTALSLVVDEIPTSHYYSALYGGPVRVAPYATFGSVELADNVAKAMTGRRGALMSNHGAVVAAKDLKAALDLCRYLEYICEIQLRALATGQPVKVLPVEEIAKVNCLLGSYGQSKR